MANEGVLVVAEVAGGSVATTTKEALAAGRTLQPQLGGEVAAVVLGASSDAVAKELIAHGVHEERPYLVIGQQSLIDRTRR